MKFIYPAIIHDDADGFWAEFPDLAYTSSTGATLTELVTNAQEAMELYILGALEDGQTLLYLPPHLFAAYLARIQHILH